MDKAAQAELDRINALPTVTLKDKMAIPPQRGAELPHREYRTTMDESTKTMSLAQARLEASRCMDCKKPFCTAACPISMPIPQYLKLLAGGNIEGAVEMIRATSLLPSICSRVCPHEKQCQSSCAMGRTLKDMNKGIHMGETERFCMDYEREHMGGKKVPAMAPSTGKKVAVIGSGPAGLVVAADVRREGHDVTIFEAFHKLGGVVRYGIPEFRLPKKIVDREIETLAAMGVKFETNFVIGRTRKLNDLIEKDGFDAVFVGTGAGLPLFMNIEGENLVGVFAANEYLTRANLMRAYDKENADTPMWPGKNVVVLGGGNVAMDAARMALRLGAKKVRIVYRRGMSELPARKEEVLHAQEEGVEFCTLQNPAKILGDEAGHVRGMLVDKYELGEPDEKGRPRPVKLEGQSFEIECDTVLVAIGNGSNPLISNTTPDLTVDKKGHILLEDATCNKTFMEKVYAGGDIVLGAATVILAMGEGRRAAAGINEFLKK